MFLLPSQVIAVIYFVYLTCYDSVNCENKIFRVMEMPEEKMVDGLDSCPTVNPRYPVFLPHPWDCSKFYICDSGSRFLKECQLGLHFNPNINACDYPKNAGCATDYEENSKGRITGDGLYLCSTKNPERPVFIPHPDDCSKYYICHGETIRLKECLPGLHYNPNITACDYPEKAGCDKGHKEKPKGKIIEDDLNKCPAENPEHPVFLPHADDCSKFYVCDGGTAHIKECQSGLHFNPKIKACDYPSKAGCSKGHKEKPESRISGENDFNVCPAEKSEYPVLIPHSYDCNKFYICDGGSPHLKECQPGLHFNPKIKACDYPSRAECSKGKTGKTTGISSPFCPLGNGKFPIFFRHPTNCSIYYMCGNGLAYEFICPTRLHFNLRKKVCDYEWKSGCQNAPS